MVDAPAKKPGVATMPISKPAANLPVPTPVKAVPKKAPVQSIPSPAPKSPRVDENGNPYSVKNPPKLPVPKPGESLKFPPVPKMRPDPPKKPATVEDKKLIQSLLYMKQNNFMKEPKSTIKFDSVKEAEDAAKEDVMSAISERMHNIQQDISEMQKKGHELKIQIMKLLQIPLKSNLWKSTRSAKDLQKIFTIILQVEAVVNPIKELQAKKDVENEKRIRDNEAKLEKSFKDRKARHQELFAPIPKQVPQKTTPKPPIPSVSKPISVNVKSVAQAQQKKPSAPQQSQSAQTNPQAIKK